MSEEATSRIAESELQSRLGNRTAALRSAIPKSIKRITRAAIEYLPRSRRLLAHYWRDFRRFRRWSSVTGLTRRRSQLQAWLDADVHKIEKALALRSPRPGFGRPVVRRLIANANRYLDSFGADRTAKRAIESLVAYREFNERFDTNEIEFVQELERLVARVAGEGLREYEAVAPVDGATIRAAGSIDFERFVAHRHSIRQFSEQEVSPELIARAVRIATRSPSVCNRQAAKVYAYFDRGDREEVLRCQAGNAGFGDQAACALVITVDLQRFISIGERNQAWIDGGMFSMSLVYALHSLGLGSCCLNWAVEKEADQKLRRVANIPDSEVVVMLLAVGHLPDSFSVAGSARKPVDEVLIRRSTHRDER